MSLLLLTIRKIYHAKDKIINGVCEEFIILKYVRITLITLATSLKFLVKSVKYKLDDIIKLPCKVFV